MHKHALSMQGGTYLLSQTSCKNLYQASNAPTEVKEQLLLQAEELEPPLKMMRERLPT